MHMKKIILPLLILGILVIAYKAYPIQKNEIKENTQAEKSQVSTLADKKTYNKIKNEWPKGDILGNILDITENTVTIKELINWKCFYAFDYLFDEDNKLSNEEIDTKYNLEYFPWCKDPSGGTSYEETGKNLTLNFKNTTSFFIITYNPNVQLSRVEKNIFIQRVKEHKPYNMMVTLTVDGNTVVRMEEVYND